MRLSGHRNLFNADCNTLFYNPELWQPEGGPYTAAAIHRFVGLLADSGIDTLLMNPNTQVAWYPSKTMPTILDRYTRDSTALFHSHAERGCRNAAERAMFLETNVRAMNLRLDLVEAGVDWLAEVAVACRQRGIHPWLSVRMNDLHGSGDPDGSHLNCELFKDPANRVDSTYPKLQGFNYAVPAVREYMFAFIRELIEDYAYEGIELDWMRFPVCCAPVATQETIELMTAWTADVRALAQQKAQQTGRPYPLGVRMPVSFGLLRSIGLDVKAWVTQGLVDFLGVTNSWQTSWTIPYDHLREEFGDTVTLYGQVEVGPSGVTGYAPAYAQGGVRYVSATRPLLYGNAAGKLVLGADGIEQFNFYVADSKTHGIPRAQAPNATEMAIHADYAALRQIADLEALRGEEKLYTLASIDGPYVTPLFETPDDVPTLLEPGGRRTFRLPMCAEPVDQGLELVIQVVIDGETVPDLRVSFNGGWPQTDGQISEELLFPTGLYTHHVPGRTGVHFRYPVHEIVDGWNEIVLAYPGACDPTERPETQALRLVNLEVAVRKPRA